MRVAFDSRPAADMGGIGRYARCLLAALRDTAQDAAELHETHRPRGADVYHAPWMQGAILRSPCPMVVTLHDLTPLKRRSEHLRMGSLPTLRHLAVQRATLVIVPSTAVAEDAVARLDIDRERISVIPAAADPALRRRSEQEIAAARQRYGLPERYLLSVGGMQRPGPRKQLVRLTAHRLQMPLAVVGPVGPWARELPGVIATGPVTDGDLAAIYSGAHALLMPSEEESCGLPAIEALACGTPVAAFETPALREVLGERVRLMPPGDLEALIEAAESLQRPAPAPLGWSWREAGTATWSVYEQAIAMRAGECVSRRRLRRPARDRVAQSASENRPHAPGGARHGALRRPREPK